MYHQRRGYATAQQVSDDAARNQNLTLMQHKRKRMLEEQLESKLETQRQYASGRQIGMRGQAVPQRDMELLQEQIDNIRRQLDELTGGGGAYPPSGASSIPATPHSGLATPHGQQQQQQQPSYNAGGYGSSPGPLNTPSGGQNRFQPSAGAPPGGMQRAPEGSPMAIAQNQQQTSGRPNPPGGSAGSRPQSKREQVWHAKYQRWLAREREASRQSQRGGGGGGGMQVPPLSGGPLPGGFSPVPLDGASSAVPPHHMGFAPTPSASGRSDMPGYQQQQSDPNVVRYGRRATPPTEAQRPPVVPPMQANNFQPQQQQQQAGGYGGAGPRGAPPPSHFSQQQQQQQQQQQMDNQQARYGRRANQSSGLW